MSDVKKILVIEDSMIMQHLISEMLTTMGYHVRCVATAEEGLRLLMHQPFYAALVDVILPDRDGYEIVAELARRGIATACIIATSHGDIIEDLKDERLKNVCGYLAKPFTRDELTAALARVRDAHSSECKSGSTFQ